MREEKMILIMDAALEHFASEGYYQTTIEHIACHAKISKGLMYNYFESKESLLKAIIQRSVNEVYQYFDTNRDGYLSGEEFEFFIRKIFVLLEEKKHFWRLVMQLLTQNDVRNYFLNVSTVSDSKKYPGDESGDFFYLVQILKIFRDYFNAKKERMGQFYDPESDYKMFFYTLLGFSINSIYSEKDNKESHEKSINRIIQLFK